MIEQPNAADPRTRGETGALAAAGDGWVRSLVQHTSDIIAVVSPDGSLRYVSPSVERALGHAAEELLGDTLYRWVHRDDQGALRARLSRNAGERAAEFRLRTRGGEWRCFDATIIDLLDDPSVAGFVIDARDVTERRRLERQLTQQAFYDALTGLPNRALFMNRLEQALAAVGRRTGGLAVLFLDLDGFKLVNDSLGHRAGDELLGAVARRLSGGIRRGDTIARFGGDEFTLLADNLVDAAAARAVADRLIGALHRPFLIEGHEVIVGVSVGIATWDGVTALRPDDLLREADIALYQAKEQGKGRAVVFDAGMNHQVVARVDLEMDLRRAVEQREMTLLFQPEMCLRTGVVAALEALVRWRRPREGLLAPSAFIGMAEETGLIHHIGQWTLEEACGRAVAWPAGPDLSVNLSARQFRQPALADQIADALNRTGLAPSRLQVEISERAAMQDADETTRILTGLKHLGIRIAIDDFGAGYSSLSYLRRFPVDTLKIDRSLIRDLGADAEALEVVRALVSLAHALRMKVTAEGIETTAQLAQARALDCDRGQGYYLAPPLEGTDAAAFIATATLPNGAQ